MRVQEAGGVHLVHFGRVGDFDKVFGEDVLEELAAVEGAVVGVGAEDEVEEGDVGDSAIPSDQTLAFAP